MSDQESKPKPEGGDEGKSLLFQTLHFMWKNAKKSKKDFCEFIKYYNEHKAELNLDEDEISALKELREMWCQINELTEFSFYANMKEKHTRLNGQLLVGKDGIQKDSLWGKYILNFQAWRGRAMMLQYQLLKCVGAIEKSEQGSTASKINGAEVPTAKN